MNLRFVHQKNAQYGSGRGVESAGYLGSMAGRLLSDAQHGLHVSRLLADARHQLHRYVGYDHLLKSKLHCAICR